MELAAIDIGSGITKGISGERCVNLPSLAGPYDSEQFNLQDNDDHLVCFAGKRFCVGEPTRALVGPDERADTLSAGWYQSDAYMAMMYKVLSEVVGHHSDRAALCTGLPVAFYGSDKDKLADRLTGTHKFSVGGKKYEMRMRRTNIHVMPQAIGLYFVALDSFDDIGAGPTGFIDVGTYTTGFVVIEGNSVREWASGGATIGMHSVIEDLDRAIKERYGMKVDRAETSRYLTQRRMRVRGNTIDLNATIEQIVQRSGDRLVKQIQKLWGDGKDLNVIVGGGGAETYFQSLSTVFPHARRLTQNDPHMSVVRGYAKYLSGKYPECALTVCGPKRISA